MAVRLLVEVEQWPFGNESFTAAFASREKKRDVCDLIGEGVNGAVNPDDLLVGVRKDGAGWDVVALEPGLQRRIDRFLLGGNGSAGDIEAEEAHGIKQKDEAKTLNRETC